MSIGVRIGIDLGNWCTWSNTRFILRLVAISFIPIVLTACTSMHDFRKDGHNVLLGGFYDFELKPGLHRVVASSNLMLWTYKSAPRTTWRERAEQLCGEQAYQELDVKEYSRSVGAGGIGGGVITVKEGFALCPRSKLTLTGANAEIQRLAKWVQEMDLVYSHPILSQTRSQAMLGAGVY